MGWLDAISPGKMSITSMISAGIRFRNWNHGQSMPLDRLPHTDPRISRLAFCCIFFAKSPVNVRVGDNAIILAPFLLFATSLSASDYLYYTIRKLKPPRSITTKPPTVNIRLT